MTEHEPHLGAICGVSADEVFAMTSLTAAPKSELIGAIERATGKMAVRFDDPIAYALMAIHDQRMATMHDDWEMLMPLEMHPTLTRASGYAVRHVSGIDGVHIGRKVEVK